MPVYNIPTPDEGGLGPRRVKQARLPQQFDAAQDQLELDAISSGLGLFGSLIEEIQRDSARREEKKLQRSDTDYKLAMDAIDTEQRRAMEDTDEHGAPKIFEGDYSPENVAKVAGDFDARREAAYKAAFGGLSEDAQSAARDTYAVDNQSRAAKRYEAMSALARAAEDNSILRRYTEKWEDNPDISSITADVEALEADSPFHNEGSMAALRRSAEQLVAARVANGLSSADISERIDIVDKVMDRGLALDPVQQAAAETNAIATVERSLGDARRQVMGALKNPVLGLGALEESVQALAEAAGAAEDYIPAATAEVRTLERQARVELERGTQARNAAVARMSGDSSTAVGITADGRLEMLHAQALLLQSGTSDVGSVATFISEYGHLRPELAPLLANMNPAERSALSRAAQEGRLGAASGSVAGQILNYISGTGAREGGGGRQEVGAEALDPTNEKAVVELASMSEADKYRLGYDLRGLHDIVDDDLKVGQMGLGEQFTEIHVATTIDAWKAQVKEQGGRWSDQAERLAVKRALETRDAAMAAVVQGLRQPVDTESAPTTEEILGLAAAQSFGGLRVDPLAGGRLVEGGIMERYPASYTQITEQLLRRQDTRQWEDHIARRDSGLSRKERNIRLPELDFVGYEVVEEWPESEEGAWGARVTMQVRKADGTVTTITDDKGNPAIFEVGERADRLSWATGPAYGERVDAAHGGRGEDMTWWQRNVTNLFSNNLRNARKVADKSAVESGVDRVPWYNPAAWVGGKYQGADQTTLTELAKLAEGPKWEVSVGPLSDEAPDAPEAPPELMDLLSSGIAVPSEVTPIARYLNDYESRVDTAIAAASMLEGRQRAELEAGMRSLKEGIATARGRLNALKWMDFHDKYVSANGLVVERAESWSTDESMVLEFAAYAGFAGIEPPDEGLSETEVRRTMKQWMDSPDYMQWMELSPAFRRQFLPEGWK